ncbi:MAG: tripartite tricarboxylate transporter substrate binding protein [Clostridia bacterium]|jgi:tripartite-type tricarboxylate transporter receptor subunit TctC|nr:tripartite tricarboxylate transporter substrate binding protein [Clostridia bacterium]
MKIFLNSKKLVLIASLVFLVLVVVVGCGGGNSNQGADQSKVEQPAETPKDNFPEKNITWILPVGVGGGFDVMARTIQPYWEKHLPNNPSIVIRNMPGGEWSIGINEVFRADSDGYTVGFFNIPGNLTGQVTGRVNYDLEEITWLGIVGEVPYVIALSPRSKYKTLQDLQNATQVKIASEGLGSTAGLGVMIAAETMGINMINVPVAGSSEAITAAMRGDVDLVQYPIESTIEYFKSGDLIPLLVYMAERSPLLPDTPTIVEAGYEELLSVVQLTRIVGATPGIPKERVEILRKALEDAVNDPGYREAMGGRGITYGSPEAAARAIEDGLRLLEKYKASL